MERSSQHRSESQENKIRLVDEEDDTRYAKIDHLSKKKKKAGPGGGVPKEVLEMEEHMFKLRDENEA